MDTYYLSTQYLQSKKSEVAGSVYVLIHRSLNFLLHGNSVEGISLLVQAHTHLTAEMSQLVNLLEAVINTCTRYNVAQEALLNASSDYLKAEAERQTQLSILADMLATQDGQFIVRRGGQLLELCRSRKGQAILRYLVAQPDYRATTDMLMGVLWPDEEPAIARRRLQVATSTLRSSLNQGYDCDPGGGYILFRGQLYQINPSVALQTDVDKFLTLYQAGQRAHQPEMIASYEHACHLYRGPFLVEDLYEDWSMRHREQLSQAYLTMCGVLSKHFLDADHYKDAAHWAKAILDENRCDEEAHRQLMRAYAAQGRRSDALRQYHNCEQILMEDLNVAPMPETLQIYQDILLGQISST